jgi:hypothetical protein
MFKKGLMLGFIAVLSAGLVLTGCSQATDSTATTVGRNSLYGTVTVPILQSRIDAAIAAGESIILEDNLTINTTGGTVVDFKTARVHVNGSITATGVTINAVDAAVTWEGDDGEFATSTGGYLYRRSEDITKADGITLRITSGTGAQFVDRLQDITESATRAAVRNFTFGPVADNDYSTGTAIPIRVNATGLNTLYVLGELTVPPGGVPPSVLIADGIRALGTVNVTGNDDTVLSNAKVFLTNPATITSKVVGGVVVTIASGTLPNVRVESGQDITIKDGITDTFTIPGKLDGPGTLRVIPVIATGGTVTIGGGNGNVVFEGTITSGNALTIKNTGTAAFKDDVAITAASITIAGDAVFEGNVTTTTSGAVSFGGNVTLHNGKAVTLAYATAVDTLTLALGKTISVGGALVTGGGGERIPVSPVLKAAMKTVLTPADGAVLTAAAAYNNTASDEAKAAAKQITLDTAALAITSGDLRVVEEGIFTIDGIALSTASIFGALSLEPGGVINLADNTSIINFGIAAAETAITGDAAVVTSLTAKGAVVTLGQGAITGAGATLTPHIATGGAAGTNDMIIGPIATKSLTLDGATLDLSESGKLTILGTGSVTLVNQGKLFLVPDGFPNTYDYISYTPNFGVIGGGTRIALGATEMNETSPVAIAISSIAHQSGAGVTISGDGTNALSFIKGSGLPLFSKIDS